MTTKAAMYSAIISTCNKDVRFIANVIMSQCRKPTMRLRALMTLAATHDVGILAYTMPHEAFCVDGIAVRFEILDAPGGFDIERYRYVSRKELDDTLGVMD